MSPRALEICPHRSWRRVLLRSTPPAAGRGVTTPARLHPLAAGASNCFPNSVAAGVHWKAVRRWGARLPRSAGPPRLATEPLTRFRPVPPRKQRGPEHGDDHCADGHHLFALPKLDGRGSRRSLVHRRSPTSRTAATSAGSTTIAVGNAPFMSCVAWRHEPAGGAQSVVGRAIARGRLRRFRNGESRPPAGSSCESSAGRRTPGS
jgi:hypothetical protein